MVDFITVFFLYHHKPFIFNDFWLRNFQKYVFEESLGIFT
jgi:hypothetical protein